MPSPSALPARAWLAIGTPLDQEVQANQEKSFREYYHLKFEPEAVPSDSLFGRLHREFEKNRPSVFDLAKIRTAAQGTAARGRLKRKRVGENLYSDQPDDEKELPDLVFASVLEFVLALRVLVHGWSLVNTGKRKSRNQHAGGDVMDCDLSEGLAYLDFVQQRALEHPGTPQQVVAFLLDRDRQTRTKARTLYVDGWPWGEALREAREKHCAVLWTVGPIRKTIVTPTPWWPTLPSCRLWSPRPRSLILST